MEKENVPCTRRSIEAADVDPLTFAIAKKYRTLKDPCHLISKYVLSLLVLFPLPFVVVVLR